VRAGGVAVLPDDLAQIVDAERFGAIGGQGIVEGGVGAVAAAEEAVLLLTSVVEVIPDDLARGIDSGCRSPPRKSQKQSPRRSRGSEGMKRDPEAYFRMLFRGPIPILSGLHHHYIRK
jgi:hypothetical protein